MVESALRNPDDLLFLTGDSLLFVTSLDDDTGPGASVRSGFGVQAGGVSPFDPELAGAKGGNPPDHAKGGGGGEDDGGSTDPNILSSYTSDGDPDRPDSEEYNIEIIFEGSWTEALQQHFITAADYLSNVILADIGDVFYRGKIIDDIRIDASLVEIDGEGGVLGRAGPTAYRTANYLPATAIMEFDIADAEVFDGLGLFDDIVLHEMLHSIGFGTMWDLMGLTSGSIEDGDLVFIGENAMGVYGDPVPVETDGGSGTAGGHWDETTFDNELMTGYIDDPNYIGDITIAALEDMGYDTVWDDVTNGEGGDLYDNTMPADPINDALIA